DAADERERHSRAMQLRDEELRTQNLRFETALKSMTQGLCVFDAEHRLVICNEPYLRMYDFTREQVKPGTPFREILELRIKGDLHGCGSPADFIRERQAAVATGAATIIEHTLPDGRIIRLAHHPMPGGGWVATHEE